MEAVHEEDGGEGSMQCARHPFKSSAPAGGICAFCLQEKLGKLVSSSYAAAVFPSSPSSSSSPSSRSTHAAADPRAAAHHHHSQKPRLPSFSSKKKKKCKDESSEMVFKRSKSTAAASTRGIHFFDEDYSPSKRRFWKFLHLSRHPTSRKSSKHVKNQIFSSPTAAESRKGEEFVVVEEEAAFDRKVSRSRSVGCGSRSFSGDFFERISTGFGDCTLRRVESQREGRPKIQSLRGGEDCSRQRVRCGGIFGGFGLTSSSSSSHLIAASDSSNGGGKSMVGLGHLSHGRSRSWGWALASPMRAFGKNSAVKRGDDSAKNAAPNLAAIPSLLAVGG
ncbi:uncharacterized protein LOC131023653 [Salvia miltiorrhiza]|uniref:uncharacterized protein LOC131023653 n=1 Tax=Salvia miltiorrhiza TaxID=226208 RepID=UPI0025ABD1BD|nr:uncharacterized protein LOC131023653 [Salvia miltiorrhiza]